MVWSRWVCIIALTSSTGQLLGLACDKKVAMSSALAYQASLALATAA